MNPAVEIAPEVFAAAPDYVLGVIAVPEVAVLAVDGRVEPLLAAAEEEVHTALPDRASVAALPQIAAWRRAYTAVGTSPSRFPCAAEAVLRRVAGGGRLPRINGLVDLCNAFSLRHRLPVAAMDTAELGNLLTIRRSVGDETYAPLGGGGAVDVVAPGEVVYVDRAGRAHSRRWNWRQGDLVKTVPGTRQLLLTVESAHPGGRAEVERAAGELAAAVAALGAEPGPVLVLSADRPAAAPFAASALAPAGAR